MKNETKDDVTFDTLIDEFSFKVPGFGPLDTGDGKSPEELAAEAEAAKLAAKKDESGTEDKSDEEKEEEAEAARLAAENEGDDDGDDDDNGSTPPVAKGKSNSFYKDLALKYIEKGTWDKDLALVDEDGKEIPIEDIEDLNEETFFQIQESINASKEEERSTKYLSIAEMDERRKNLVTIIAEGGDLASIFKDEKQVEQYLNPFSNLDLDDESVQERIYLNSLITYNKLDKDVAMAVVKKAKTDLTLDGKVKDFVDQYTKKMDAYVESKKKEVILEKQSKKEELTKFKKSLTEEYKSYGLKDSLVRKLTDSAVKETEEGYQIDSIYDQKMQDPKEAAELILFLNDKEAYLESKLRVAKTGEQKKIRKLIKMIPEAKSTKSADPARNDSEKNEFEFNVNAK